MKAIREHAGYSARLRQYPAGVNRAVEATFREQFPSTCLSKVVVSRGLDGCSVIYIKVVYDGDVRQLKPKAIAGFVRHLRPRLAAIGEHSFPIVTYISRKELLNG